MFCGSVERASVGKSPTAKKGGLKTENRESWERGRLARSCLGDVALFTEERARRPRSQGFSHLQAEGSPLTESISVSVRKLVQGDQNDVDDVPDAAPAEGHQLEDSQAHVA